MPADTINLVRPDGTIVSATPEEAQRLQVLGYQPEDSEAQQARLAADEERKYYSTTGQQFTAGAEGLASGLTVGLSDFVFDDEDSRQRAAFNPGTRLAGQVIGAIAPSLITGGTVTPAGALSAGSRAVAEGAGLGRLGTAALGAGIEGGIASAGAEAGNAHLAGDPITAESLLAAAGWGTVFSAGLGAGLHGVGVGAERLGARVDAERASRAVDELLAESRAAGPVLGSEDFNTLRNAVSDVRRTASQAVGDVDIAAEKAHVAAKAERAAVSKAHADAAALPEPSLSGAEPAPPTSLSPAQAQPLTEEGAKIGRNELKALKTAGDEVLGVSTLTGKAATAEGKAATSSLRRSYAAAKEAAEAGDAIGLRKALDDYRAAITTHSETLATGTRAPEAFPGVVNLESAEARQAFARGEAPGAAPAAQVAGRATPEMSPALAEMIDAAGKRAVAESGKALEDVSELRAASRVLNSFPTSTEQFLKMRPARAEAQFAALEAALRAGGPEVEGLKTALGAAADRLATSTGVATEGSVVDRLRASWKALGTAEREGSKAAAAAAGGTGEKSGARKLLDRVLRQSSSRGASSVARGLGAGAFMSSGAYQLAGAAMGALTGGPVGMGILAEITGIRAAVQRAIRSGAADYLPGVAKAAARGAAKVAPLAVRIDGAIDAKPGTPAEMFHRRSEEIRQAAVTGKDTLFRAVQPLQAEGFTDFAAALHDSASKQLDALLSFLPRDPGDQRSGGKSLWDPDDVDILSFERVYEVFHDPVGTTLNALASGDITPDAAAALQAFAPSLFAELRNGVVERLTSDEEFASSLSYEDQAQLSVLCDLELHSTFSSDWIEEQQMMFQELDEPLMTGGRQTSGPMGPGRPPGPASVSGATPAQQLTER